METALILVRWGQYLGAAGLFGGALFLSRQPVNPDGAGERRLLFRSAVLLVGFTLAALVVQAANMAGHTRPVVDAPMIGMVMTGTSFGYSVAVRLATTSAALLLLLAPATIVRLRVVTALGAAATASLAWGGHGAADEGWRRFVHLATDVVHLLAAGLWIGALAALTAVVLDPRVRFDPSGSWRAYRALDGFSGAGTLAVGLLVATGLVNGWFLIGPAHFTALVTTRYGRVLIAKLALFAMMAGLAAANRWRLTPRLGVALSSHAPTGRALDRLRRSVLWETTLAAAVLALVAWLGTLEPPTSG